MERFSQAWFDNWVFPWNPRRNSATFLLEPEKLEAFGEKMKFINEPETASTERQVANLFGLYKAEWLNGQLFDLFTEPEYFNELKTKRPCVLIGGRGTGKTTVLRGMSYEGQFALSGHNAAAVRGWPFYGIYHRVNTNRVMAFSGPELGERQWIRCFAHYMNLLLCGHLLDFVQWYSSVTSDRVNLNAKSLRRVAASLNLGPCSNLVELSDALDEARVLFEASINNVADEQPKNLSLQGAPLDELTDTLHSLPEFKGKQFFFLIDEYENYQDYQQQVVNTLIKHARPTYTFKIGVRELGWRIKATLNEAEHLRHPADYARININEEFSYSRFREFARQVCNGRLARGAKESAIEHAPEVSALLPGLHLEDEAVLLGVADRNQLTVAELQSLATQEELNFVKSMTPASLYLSWYLADAAKKNMIDVIREAINDQEAWKNLHNNYMHAALFTVRRGKPGIRKYYVGWDVFARIADGNIRYLLELVHRSLLNHFESGHSINIPVNPRQQTEAAQQVGRKNLAELEGITVEGGRLTKLLLSLGRIFQVLAETPTGHTPEVNQFYLSDPNGGTANLERGPEVDQLLNSAVMHLALVRSPGNKLLDESDTREYDYMIHPIFAPFFGFSHRRKRKLRLSGGQLLGLIEKPKVTIREVLAGNNRVENDELPDQLRLFEGYYRGDQ